MRKLYLLIFLALMAIPALAQFVTTPTGPPPTQLRDPFAKPTDEQLNNMPMAPQPKASDIEAASEAASVEATVPAAQQPVASDRPETHAVMTEGDTAGGDTSMWVLGGIAALGLIGALAYVTLGMGQNGPTAHNV